jgi:hypothetical protein
MYQRLFLLLFCLLSTMGQILAQIPGNGQYRFSVLLAPHELNGTLPITITPPGGTPQAGTITVALGPKGALAGTMTLAPNTYTISGFQKATNSGLSVKLTATGPGGAIKLNGSLKADGYITGKSAGGKDPLIPKGSVFAIDARAAKALVAKMDIQLSADAKGVVSGSGTARFLGQDETVSVKGKLTKAVVDPRRGTVKKGESCTLTLSSSSISWSGKGSVLEDGFAFAWKAKGGGGTTAGSLLPVKSTDADQGSSAGQIVVADGALDVLYPRSTSMSFEVIDAVLTSYPDEVTAQLNLGTVPASSLGISGNSITINPLNFADGKNTLIVNAKDELGRSMSSTFVFWSGTYSLTVTVVDELGNPVPGADVFAAIGDSPNVVKSGISGANGTVIFTGLPDRTITLEASTASGLIGTTSVVGTGGSTTVKVIGFKTPSAIANNDFSTGTTAGWEVSPGAATIIAHDEGDTGAGALAPPANGAFAVGPDYDMELATLGEGPQLASRTAAVSPGTKALKVRYRFITTEVPGGYFGSKYNDYFAIVLRTQSGGGFAAEANTMNNMGLAAFDPAGRTAWREVTLPVTDTGDVFQVNMLVANVGDGAYDSYLIVDKIEEVKIDLVVTNAERQLLETNRFEIKVDGGAVGSNFKIEISRAGSNTWYPLSTNQIENNFKQRVAGAFNLRGKVTIEGQEYTTPMRALTVRFPAANDIKGAATCVAAFDASWTSTKASATATQRREEAFWVQLNTNSNKEDYELTTKVFGPWVTNLEGAWVDPGATPADNPAAPAPNATGAVYTVGIFHTHTPTVFRTVGRGVGPSGADGNYANAKGMPIFAYDYVGDASGNSPAGHPLNSAAKVYTAGPTRRATP